MPDVAVTGGLTVDAAAWGHGTSVTLRSRLRDATATAHAHLDAQFSALNLQRLADYRCFLEAIAAALLPLEAVLVESGVTRLVPDWGLRSRSHAVARDLDSLGGIVRPLALPARFDRPGILGTVYVLEGSRLGAKVLLKTVAASPDPVVAGTTAYLRHGAGQRLWPGFLGILERHATTISDEADMTDAACRAFDLFAQAMALTTGRVDHARAMAPRA